MSTILHSESQDFFKVRTVNSSDSSFPSRLPTITEPTGVGGSASNTASVIDVAAGVKHAPAGMLVCPYGLGSNNDGFSIRVIGWKRVGRNTESVVAPALWIPVRICEVACLISSTAIGIANSPVLNTEMFCDTLTLVANMGTQGTNVDVISPQDDSVGHFLFSVKGFSKIEFLFDTTTNSPTMNALAAFV